MYITPGSPWENRYVESFNGAMANELLSRELFDTLFEARTLLARWIRPHSALGYRPPAPEAHCGQYNSSNIAVFSTTPWEWIPGARQSTRKVTERSSALVGA